MTPIVSVLLTLVLFAGLIYGIIKKFNAVMLLFFLGLIGSILYAVVSKQSLVAEGSSGSAVMDSFVYFFNQWKAGFTGNALTIMCICGYVGYMAHLKASDMFAILIARQLLRFKNAKWVAAGIAIILIYWVGLGVPSGVGFLALLFGTFYPILRYLGMTGLAAASVLTVGLGVFTGPADVFSMIQMQMFGMDPATLPSIWASKTIFLVFALHFGLVLAWIPWNKYCDKKDLEKNSPYIHNDPMPVPDPKDLGVPYWYGIMPLLPLIFIMGFNSMFNKVVTLPIVSSVVLAFCVAFILRAISAKKDLAAIVEEGHTYFKEVGASVAYIGMILVCGMFFSNVLTAIGGFSVLTNFLLENLHMSMGVFLVIFSLISALMYGLTGSNSLSVYAITPLVANTILANKPEWALLGLCCMTVVYGNFAAIISPISSANMLAANTEKVPVFEIIKRGAVPCFCGMVTSMIMAFVLYA